MVDWEKLTSEEQKVVMDLLVTQIYIQETADIDYTCYFYKINELQFWERFLNFDLFDNIIKEHGGE